MLARQRYTKILELLNRDGIVHTAELIKLMDVSSKTIRKDLGHLDNQGRLSRVHGRAVPADLGKPADTSGRYASLQIRNSQNLKQKAAVTSRAAGLVSEGQVIILDYGSTSQVMALVLKERFHNPTAMTNSIRNALMLIESPSITIALTGDILNRDEYTLVSESSPTLESVRIDIVFMAMIGIDPVIGCAGQRLSEIRIQNQMHRSAARTVVLAGFTKFGKASLFKICPFEEVGTIVTDSGIPPQMESRIQGTGTKFIIA